MRQATRSGAARARNRAISVAKGRFVAFLDSDDAWLPQKLARQLPEMLRHDAVLSYTAYKKMDAKGRPGSGIVHVPETVTYAQLLDTCVIGCLTAVYDRSKIGRVLMPDLLRRQDYGLWLRILKGNRQVEDAATQPPPDGKNIAIGINEPLALYRVHNEGLSKNKLKAAYYQWQVYRDCEKLSIARSLYHLAQYARHGYRKSRIA
jgi:glycosyltransferase involved in cell wall biosynthesis